MQTWKQSEFTQLWQCAREHSTGIMRSSRASDGEREDARWFLHAQGGLLLKSYRGPAEVVRELRWIYA